MMCGAPEALPHLGAPGVHSFLVKFSPLCIKQKYQKKFAQIESRRLLGGAKQFARLSLGQNIHGQPIHAPFCLNTIPGSRYRVHHTYIMNVTKLFVNNPYQ